MNLSNAQYKIDDNSILNYYHYGTAKEKLLLLHAQGTSSLSYSNVIAKLSKHYQVYLVDYYGHGMSSHNPEKYNLVSIGNDIIDFIENVICDNVTVLGHSSGGLIAAYIAANCDKCNKLILEDPPLFSSWGERRYNTYNYKDLSTVCHNFLSQNEEKDFVYYYFKNQYCWNFFPDNSRENIREKLCDFALKYRIKHPDKNLKVLFWPKKFLEAFNGLQYYDPLFGEAFYNDSFNNNVDYNKLLSKIKCKTLFMKANTTIGEDGLLQGALSDDDLQKVNSLIKNMNIEKFNCGHGIHTEKPKQFVQAIISI
ncbi:MAG: alpha/beta hydrolase [Ruminococcus sp.]|nr:alpha/beta hydrolase [Ruminococcus sp.]